MLTQSFRQTLFIALAIASLVLVEAVVIVGGRLADDALELRRHTHEALLAIGEVNERKDHTESLVREFVLRGEESLGTRALNNSSELTTRLAHARQLMGDNTNQIRRLERLDAIIKELTARFTLTIETRRTAGAVAATKLVSEGTGRRLTDEAEFILDEMAAEENRLLAERSSRAARYSDFCNHAAKAGGVLTVLFGLLAARALRSNADRLRASEESLAVTLHSIGDGVLATDAKGRITRLNLVAEQLTGWPNAEAIGHPVADVFHIVNETTRAPAFLPVADTLAKGTIHGLANHTVLIARDGTERPIADSCAPILDRAGEVIGAVLVFRDVTEEREHEAALRRAHEGLEQRVRERTAELELERAKLAAAFGNMPMGVVLSDAQGGDMVMNAAAERMHGFASREDMHARVGDYVKEWELRDATGRVLPFAEWPLPRAMAGDFCRDWEIHLHNLKSGYEWDCSYTAVPVRNSGGEVSRIVLTLVDITERKRAQDEIRGLNARLEQRVEERTCQLHLAAADLRRTATAIAAMQDAVFMFAADTLRFFFVNDGALRQVGYSREELLTMTPLSIKPDFTEAQFRELVAPLLDGRKAIEHFTTVHRHKDGTDVPVEINLQVVGEGEQRCFVALSRDVAERQRADATLRQALTELSRANAELDDASRHKDEFLANMSHELRTPLNAILGLSEALLEQTNATLTPRQLKSVTTISTSGQHLLALINDILDLSKIEAGKLELHAEPLNVDEFCQSCLVFVKTQAMQKQIYVDHQRDPRTLVISADAKRLKQILVNLLTNAVKFTPPGGRIGLSVAAPEGEDVVRFTVWDTGIGIAAEDQAKLFSAFTQVDSGLNRSQEGTGLGLALVAKLVELHGGSVSLESEPGKGSRFIVTLPLAVDREPEHPSPALRAPSPLLGGGERDGVRGALRSGSDAEVAGLGAHSPGSAGAPQTFRHALVIEDDPTAGDQLVHYLTLLGMKSALHVRGAESVQAAVREKPDVILLDVLLPDESGWMVLARLKEHPATRHIPVAVVSVVDEPEKSLAMGAAAHFTKPFTREQLAGFLQRPFTPKPARVPRPAPKAPSAGPVILLAEDNEANVQTIGGYLDEKGYAMHYAMNGLVAVKLARDLRPALILMDIQMPVMDGLTAIRELRADATLRDIPIIALTALAMSGDRERCIAAGANDYMSKPVKLKELAGLVEKFLKRDA
ncbi:MAG: response regulator [Verrucomicrobia bacterium]|nr:response regulator [Verrucomicrobiota bacterium]